MRKMMRTTLGAAVLTGIVSAGAPSVHAAEGLYMGPSLTGYYLDSERFNAKKGHGESGVYGLNLGYRFLGDWAVEVGAGRDFVGDDMDVLKLDFLHWFGDDTQTWRPYVVLGGAYYEIEEKNLQLTGKGHGRHSSQVSLGAGVSRMLDDHWEFRSDVRALHQVHHGKPDGVFDGALNVAVNYYFSAPPKAPVAVAPPPAPVAKPKPQPKPEARTITVRLNVEFEFDKAVVRAIYGDELKAIADAMKAHDDIDLVLEGHTDSIGSDRYNQDLSERRAAAVKAKLVSMYGIPASRITTVGFGETRPIADNKTDEGRQRNRRVIGALTFTEVAPR